MSEIDRFARRTAFRSLAQGALAIAFFVLAVLGFVVVHVVGIPWWMIIVFALAFGWGFARRLARKS